MPVDEKMDYTGFKVLSVGPLKNEEELARVEEMRDDETGQVQIFDDVITKNDPITMTVSPDRYDQIRQVFDELNIDFEVIDEDLQKTFNKNRALNNLYEEAYHAKAKRSGKMPAPNYYMTYDQMVSEMNRQANSYSIARTFTMGRSYEGRTMYGVSINDGANSLPAIWLDAGIHAREWIAPATCFYILDRILEGRDADAQYLRDSFRWYISCEVNPDGYEYSRTRNRMWRKTRVPYGGCYGADPNRNFDSSWGDYGTSNNPCSDTYRGPRAFSEPETQNIRDAIMARRNNMNMIISMHSFSQLWLVPWAGKLSKPSDYNDHMRIGNAAASAIRRTSGLSFRVGTPPDILYAASGGTYDWGKEKAGIRWAFTPELRPQSQWQGGFDIPPSNIYPSGEEIFAAIVDSTWEATVIMNEEAEAAKEQ